MTDTPRRLEPCPPDCDSTDEHSGHMTRSPTMTDTPEIAAGAALASALMAANYPGDSGEDVDRLIAELEKRGYRLQSRAAHIDALTAAVEGLQPRHTGERFPDWPDERVDGFNDAKRAVLAILRGEQ